LSPLILGLLLNLVSSSSSSSPVCFKVFDSDRDGVLLEEELRHMIDVLLFVCHENKSPEELALDPYGQAGELCNTEGITCMRH
jgi:Ca2+-binding EF-hand superfamily protein